MSLKKFKLYFKLMLLAPFVSTVSIMFIMPLYYIEEPVKNTGEKIIACLFWLGVIAEIVFLVLANQKRKSVQKKKLIKKSEIGLLNFFKNRFAMIADIIFVIFLILIIIFLILNMTNPFLIVISVSVLFLSFNMHCILNGKNYRYYNQIKSEGVKNG